MLKEFCHKNIQISLYVILLFELVKAEKIKTVDTYCLYEIEVSYAGGYKTEGMLKNRIEYLKDKQKFKDYYIKIVEIYKKYLLDKNDFVTSNPFNYDFSTIFLREILENICKLFDLDIETKEKAKKRSEIYIKNTLFFLSCIPFDLKREWNEMIKDNSSNHFDQDNELISETGADDKLFSTIPFSSYSNVNNQKPLWLNMLKKMPKILKEKWLKRVDNINFFRSNEENKEVLDSIIHVIIKRKYNNLLEKQKGFIKEKSGSKIKTFLEYMLDSLKSESITILKENPNLSILKKKGIVLDMIIKTILQILNIDINKEEIINEFITWKKENWLEMLNEEPNIFKNDFFTFEGYLLKIGESSYINFFAINDEICTIYKEIEGTLILYRLKNENYNDKIELLENVSIERKNKLMDLIEKNRICVEKIAENDEDLGLISEIIFIQICYITSNKMKNCEQSRNGEKKLFDLVDVPNFIIKEGARKIKEFLNGGKIDEHKNKFYQEDPEEEKHRKKYIRKSCFGGYSDSEDNNVRFFSQIGDRSHSPIYKKYQAFAKDAIPEYFFAFLTSVGDVVDLYSYLTDEEDNHKISIFSETCYDKLDFSRIELAIISKTLKIRGECRVKFNIFHCNPFEIDLENGKGDNSNTCFNKAISFIRGSMLNLENLANFLDKITDFLHEESKEIRFDFDFKTFDSFESFKTNLFSDLEPDQQILGCEKNLEIYARENKNLTDLFYMIAKQFRIKTKEKSKNIIYI